MRMCTGSSRLPLTGWQLRTEVTDWRFHYEIFEGRPLFIAATGLYCKRQLLRVPWIGAPVETIYETAVGGYRQRTSLAT
jgi:hypothetical protein